jgi:anti-sigma factor RsiW
MEGTTVRSKTCPDFEDLSCFIDDELETTQCDVVRRHLESCDRCASLTARLQRGFDGASSGLDGGVSGSRCSDEESLILYLTQGLSERERTAVETHLSRCDACVYGVALLRKRLRIDGSVDSAVPTALREKVRDLIEAGARDLAEESGEHAPAAWVHRVWETLDRMLRLPVLVPAAVAAGALLVVGLQNQNTGSGSSGIRAVEQVSMARVTAQRALVRELPRATGEVVAELRAGDQVQLAGEDRDWYRVLLSNDRTGWVEREAFE